MTVKLRVAGVGSVFPALSLAFTLKTCLPNGSLAVVWGDVQAWKRDPSSEHLKVEPASEDLNVNVGVRSWVGPEGPPVIVV